MLLYSAFYRRYGVRLEGDFSDPPVGLLEQFTLPKESIVHYVGYDDVAIGPEIEHELLKNYSGRFLIGHMTELVDPIGTPRPNRTILASAIRRDYQRRYRKIRPLHDFTRSLRDERTLIIFNSAPLHQLFWYPRNIFSTYISTYNVLKSSLSNVATACNGNDRQHFINLELPKRLPSRVMLNKASGEYTAIPRKLLTIFSSMKMLVLLELWKWLGKDREQSLFNLIPSQHYGKINIVVREGMSVTVVNLGTLLSIFNIDDDEDLDEGSTRLQRRMLILFMRLMASRNSAVITDKDDEEESATSQVDREDTDNEDPFEETVDNRISDDGDEYDDVFEESHYVPEPDPTTPIVDQAALDADDDDEKDLEMLDSLSEDIEDALLEDENEVEAPEFNEYDNPVEALKARIQHRAEMGQITPAQERRLLKMLERSQSLPAPDGSGTLEEFSQVPPETLEITDEDRALPAVSGVTDESMLESTLQALDSKYINEVMQRDIAAAITALQRAGVIVNSYKVEVHEDVANHYMIITVQVTPIDGETSTLKIRVPVVDENGVYVANGVKYRLRRQFGDMPIRKISPRQVALTSYYAKMFVERSERSVVNYPKWLTGQLTTRALDTEDPSVSDASYINVFDHEVHVPRVYSILAERFRQFTVHGKYQLYFDYNQRKKKFTDLLVDETESEGFTMVGLSGKTPIVIDNDNVFYLWDKGVHKPLGTIEEMVGLDLKKVPVEMAEFRLLSKNVPVAIALGYRFGLTRLLSILEVTPRRVPTGQRLLLEDNEYAVTFSDETLVFVRDNSKAQLILAGFNRYHQTIKRYNVDSFDNPDIYVNLLEQNGVRVTFIREIELAMDLFVDPITEEILKSMGEPTTLDQLLIRSCELLMNDHHLKETDIDAMRYRGYERISGAVYTELVRSMRRYRSRGVGSTAKVEMNPEAVWMTIETDRSKSQVEESNPIQYLKEQEIVTYLGTGGRDTQSMVKRTRVYHESDVGILSESTVDSGSVAVNANLSANPQLNSLRGTPDPNRKNKRDPSTLVSTSMLLSPGADMDDAKRVNFISIQNSHVVGSEGYKASPLRTGYERVIAHRVGDLYAYTAKQNGTVLKVTDLAIHIRYEDGTEVYVPIGTRYGNVTGTTVPHTVVSNVQAGQTFKVGHVLSYNRNFFDVDPLDQTQVLLKTSMIVTTAIMENPQTFEDASIISERVSKALSTSITYKRTVRVTFDKQIRNLVKVGDKLTTESTLCVIEDNVGLDSDVFSDDSLDILQTMSANTPKAKHAGVVEKVEVFYYGDMEDMSPSIKELVEEADKTRAKEMRAMGKKPKRGEVDGFVRIEKEPLELDSVAIVIYITKSMGVGVGDKGVFGNQLKTVFSHVMTGVNRTESGTDLDACFSYAGISARIVLSPEIIGTTNVLLRLFSKRLADEYFKLKGK